MKIFRSFIPVVLAIIFVLSMSLGTSAAQIDSAPVNAQYQGSVLAADFDVSGTTLEPEVTLPSSYSSKDLGYTLGVRNQIHNTCWAYGSSSTLESTMLKDGYSVSHFAPMHMNHWGTKRADGTGWNRNETNGGYSYISLGYFTSWQGPRLESEYPESLSLSDYPIFNPLATKQVAVNGIIYLDTGDIDTVKTAVYEYGAVVGNYHVDNNYFNMDTASYYFNTEGLATSQLNGHCISIVGWDDNYSKENFNEIARPQSDGAWLCKNSWGSYWGNNGYYWISYEDEYLFSTKFGHSYAFVDYNLYDTKKSLYQNEIDGATYKFDYITNVNTITYINVFDKDSAHSLIEKINFETESEGAKYTIYNIPVDSTGTPSKHKTEWTKIGEGTVDYKGYHTIDTEDFTVNTDKFAIGVSLTENNGSEISIGVCEWLSTGGNQIFTPQSEHGMSYFHYGNTQLMDVMDLYKDYYDDEIGGTFVIKAVGSLQDVLGDTDLDGELSIIDATHLQRYLAQLEVFNDKQIALADMDSDSVVSICDATRIQLALATPSTEFID